jgi:hypothetical protein
MKPIIPQVQIKCGELGNWKESSLRNRKEIVTIVKPFKQYLEGIANLSFAQD